MSRSLLFCALALLVALPIVAQTPCNLDISMTCASGNCTATTHNAGSNSCDGEFDIGFLGLGAVTDVTFSGFTDTLGLGTCYDSSTIPGGATESFALCFGTSSLGPGSSFTTTVHAQSNVSSAKFIAFTAVSDPTTAAQIGLVYVFNTGGTPQLTCVPSPTISSSAIQSGNPYTVSWSPVIDVNANTFVIDESTASDFSAITETRTVTGLNTQFQHSVSASTFYYYRVRAMTCNGSPGQNSPTVHITVQTIQTATGRSGDAVAPAGSTDPVSIKFSIPGSSNSVSFSASVDKPYLTVTPASGTISPGGTTVTVTANPGGLPPGANTGTLSVTSNGETSNKSVSVSLVTPVGPGSKTLPPTNALIIPVVGHAPGANGPFQSDVRLTNVSSAAIDYQLSFTKSGADATQSQQKTTVSVDPQQTLALNDIVRDFFGIGTTDAPGDAAVGSLEIRPLNSSSTLTYASSRTYTFNKKGSFGQYIAAIPFSTFATNASLVPLGPPQTASPLSLQQVAQSAKFRTNLGLVEGSGVAASGKINFYDDSGGLLKTVPYSLKPGEQQQKNLAVDYGINNLTDGRIEVTIDSAAGAVSAYASVLDNITSDPLAVMPVPVQSSQLLATRFVLPGMAEIVSPFSNFHSDVRLFNAGSSPINVTATYYPAGLTSAQFTIDPGKVRAIDNVLPSLFSSAPPGGGSIVFTTPTPSSLVATGRTYSNSTDPDYIGGTFGQFIPGVSPQQGIGMGERPLQILQLEQSNNFRSNLGVAELTGNHTTVRITAFVPDSKIAPSTVVELDPNQFTQLGSVLAGQGFNLGTSVYNARIMVEVIGGSGRVTAYGSVIDNATGDPTYVQAK
jgi:BACON domain-containing protein